MYDEPCQSAQPELLLISQTFLIVQSMFFVFGPPYNWGCAKTCQCPKRRIESAPRFRLIESWTFRQLLGKYVVRPLPGTNWEMGTFACSFCIWPRYIQSGVGGAPIPTKNCFFVWYGPVGLGNARSIDYERQWPRGLFLGWQLPKLGHQTCVQASSRVILVA